MTKVAAPEFQSEAPKGAARPIGNNQQNMRMGKKGATVADAAMPHAISQSHTLRDFEIVVTFAARGERGSGDVVIPFDEKT